MAPANPVQIQKHLKGIDYPASKQDLVKHAQQQGAGDEVLDVLNQLPEEQYETPTDVSKAVGEIE
ncbi:MAG: DUF2795 domain-containing protein [Chloroflexaceae bacterium]|nr:DUF2795 domain-containing protein [Chloroflexaceae bacterium]